MAGMVKPIGTWKTPSVSGTGLKIFACITMLIQTIGITIIEKGIIHLDSYTGDAFSEALANDPNLMFTTGVSAVMQLIGGLAVPLFAFLLVEGFRHTSDYKKYLLTMAAFALISEIPYDLAMYQSFWELNGQNGMFTLAICLVMLYFLSKAKEKKGAVSLLLKFAAILGALLWSALLRTQAGLCIVLLTAIFYLLDTKNVLKTILGAAVSLLYVTGPLAFYGIWFYNGERGGKRINKYAFYAFYPLHMLILGLITKIFMP